ncbi:MAG: hypothetical protein EHM21_05730, partial [Chloroflexi bacterium]
MRFRAWIALLLAFLLGGCGMIGGATPTPLPTVVLEEPAAGSPPGEPAAAVTTQPESAAQAPTAVTDGAAPSADDFGGSVAASAEIVPAQTADLTFSAPAQVQGLVVTEGDFVRAGEVLASQDNMKQLQSALETSQKALTAAQLDYDQLLSNVPVERANAQLALI